METIGFIGALLLAMCALPQAVASAISGNSYGLNSGFLITWYVGEILLSVFTISTVGYNNPLFINYAINVLLLTVIIYYKYFPRRSNG